MTLPAGLSVELLVGVVSFLLTLMVLSYLVGDNPAFRVAIYIFIGVAAGYASAVALHQVLVPRLIIPLLTGTIGERLLAVFPLVGGLLLLAKLFPRGARLGSPSVAFMVGVGAAVAVGGAVMGTLLPQTQTAINVFNLTSYEKGEWWYRLFEAVVMLVGTVSTLVYFHFGAKPGTNGPQRGKVLGIVAWVGQVFIAITFGVLFAGVFAAAMTAFIERISSLIQFVNQLFSLF